MRRNLVKKKLMAGETVIGTMIQEMVSPSSAQIVKQLGFDFFMLDMEHGPYTLKYAGDILRVGRILDLCPVVRVASAEYHLICQPLDHGAMGVMLPRTETREQVELLVESVKYPPMGKRGYSSESPHTEYTFGPVPEYIEMNNEDTLVIVQIERKAAVDNLDEILSVPGVDVALMGLEDLSISLGRPGQSDHPDVSAAVEKVIAACERHNVVSGIHTGGAETLLGWMDKGMRYIMCSCDLCFMMDAAAADLAKLRCKTS